MATSAFRHLIICGLLGSQAVDQAGGYPRRHALKDNNSNRVDNMDINSNGVNNKQTNKQTKEKS